MSVFTKKVWYNWDTYQLSETEPTIKEMMETWEPGEDAEQCKVIKEYGWGEALFSEEGYAIWDDHTNGQEAEEGIHWIWADGSSALWMKEASR